MLFEIRVMNVFGETLLSIGRTPFCAQPSGILSGKRFIFMLVPYDVAGVNDPGAAAWPRPT